MNKFIALICLAVSACTAAPADALVLTQPEKEIATHAWEAANTDCRGSGNMVACNARAIIANYLAKNNVCFDSSKPTYKQSWGACEPDVRKFLTTEALTAAYWQEDGGPAVSGPPVTAAFLKGKRGRYDGAIVDVFTKRLCTPGDEPFLTTGDSLYGNFIYTNGQPNVLVLPWTANVVLVALPNDEESEPEDGPVGYQLVELC